MTLEKLKEILVYPHQRDSLWHSETEGERGYVIKGLRLENSMLKGGLK